MSLSVAAASKKCPLLLHVTFIQVQYQMLLSVLRAPAAALLSWFVIYTAWRESRRDPRRNLRAPRWWAVSQRETTSRVEINLPVFITEGRRSFTDGSLWWKNSIIKNLSLSSPFNSTTQWSIWLPRGTGASEALLKWQNRLGSGHLMTEKPPATFTQTPGGAAPDVDCCPRCWNTERSWCCDSCGLLENGPRAALKCEDRNDSYGSRRAARGPWFCWLSAQHPIK